MIDLTQSSERNGRFWETISLSFFSFFSFISFFLFFRKNLVNLLSVTEGLSEPWQRLSGTANYKKSNATNIPLIPFGNPLYLRCFSSLEKEPLRKSYLKYTELIVWIFFCSWAANYQKKSLNLFLWPMVTRVSARVYSSMVSLKTHEVI